MRIGDSSLTERYWANPSNLSPAAVSSSETQPTGKDSLAIENQPMSQPSSKQGIQPDRLELSQEARDAYQKEQERAPQTGSQKQPDTAADSKKASENINSKKKSSDQSDLTPEQESEVHQLQSRDASVRTHEMQHMTAAGAYATGGPQYDMQSGPDGKQYAIGGHVNLDVSPVPDDPQATVSKAQVIQRAALAPADPSGADRAVAASAAQMEAMARMELTQEQQAKSHDSYFNATRKIHSPYAAKSSPTVQPGKRLNLTA